MIDSACGCVPDPCTSDAPAASKSAVTIGAALNVKV
jgi:hypothetical protein